MALSNNIQGRQYDSYTQVSDGTALRVVSAPDDSSAGLVYASGAAQTIPDAVTVLINKQTLTGRGGSWFVYNSGATQIGVDMYAAYVSGAVDFLATDTRKYGTKLVQHKTLQLLIQNIYRLIINIDM
jgi:hypothetical protein